MVRGVRDQRAAVLVSPVASYHHFTRLLKNVLDGVIKDSCNRLEVAVAVDESYSVRLNLENGRDALLSSVFSGVSLGEL